MKTTLLLLLFIANISFAGRFNASIEIDGFQGHIELPESINTSELEIVFQWECLKNGILPNSWKPCGRNLHGRHKMAVDENGDFTFPGVKQKYFSPMGAEPIFSGTVTFVYYKEKLIQGGTGYVFDQADASQKLTKHLKSLALFHLQTTEVEMQTRIATVNGEKLLYDLRTTSDFSYTWRLPFNLYFGEMGSLDTAKAKVEQRPYADVLILPEVYFVDYKNSDANHPVTFDIRFQLRTSQGRDYWMPGIKVPATLDNLEGNYPAVWENFVDQTLE